MARLNEKDRELVEIKNPVDLSSQKYRYLGGEFLENEDDYVEILIYDINENFLESAVVNLEEYTRDDDGNIRLKTGTILRKLGYDRGKFTIKYNFLRKVAGSYENVLVDNNNVIWNGQYHVLPNGQIKSGVGGTGDGINLYLKEYKYFLHEISPSRTEVRLAPQNITDTKYLRDFYNAQRTRETVKSNQTEASEIEFITPSSDINRADSTLMRFANGDSKFTQMMIGGKLTIPNAFLTGYTEIPIAPPPGVATEEEVEGDMQARFFLIKNASFQEIDNGIGFGDPYFRKAFEVFSGDGGQSPGSELYPGNVNGQDGAHYGYQVTPSGGVKMKNIIRLNTGTNLFQPVHYLFDEDDEGSTITLKSNSVLPNVDIPTTYVWEIDGWDCDYNQGRNQFNVGQGNIRIYHVNWEFNRIFPKQGEEGDYTIETPDDPTGAVPTGVLPNQAQTTDSTDGSILQFKLYSKNVRVGIKLTVSQATGTGTNSTSTLHLPCIIERL